MVISRASSGVCVTRTTWKRVTKVKIEQHFRLDQNTKFYPQGITDQSSNSNGESFVFISGSLNWIFLQRRITFFRLNMSNRHRKKTSFWLSKSSLMFEEPLQFAAVLIMTTLFIFGHTLGVLLSIYVLLTPLYGFIVIYLLWTYCFDLKTPAKGGRRSETFRRLKSWEYFRDYFPVRLIRTKKLDPKKNYILGYHPHGIMCAGAWANFATEATGFSNLFPGIKSHLLTLTRK